MTTQLHVPHAAPPDAGRTGPGPLLRACLLLEVPSAWAIWTMLCEARLGEGMRTVATLLVCFLCPTLTVLSAIGFVRTELAHRAAGPRRPIRSWSTTHDTVTYAVLWLVNAPVLVALLFFLLFLTFWTAG